MLKNVLKTTLLLLLFLAVGGSLYAQDLAVKGKVTDDGGEAILGVSVTVKGTQRGTITNVEGTYSINTVGNATLVFSFLGYVSQDVPINNRSTINVSLKTDTKALEEVVVVGYGTQRKSDLTGSVASVTEKDFTQGVNNCLLYTSRCV